MKQGRSLKELAVELERQHEAARDFRTPTKHVSMTNHEDRLELQVGQLWHFGINELAHDQLGTYLGIPSKYYDRMRHEDHRLLTHNVNTWLSRSNDQRLVRTLDGNVRSWLGNGYRMINNISIARMVLPILLKKGSGLKVESCEVTEKRLYIKAVDTRKTYEVQKGDEVQAGIVIGNSEVGCGSFFVDPLVYVLACLNGAIMPEAGLKRYHIGRHTAELENAVEVFSDETREADDKTLMLKMRDVVTAALDEVAFTKTAKLLSVTAENQIKRDPIEALDKAIEVMKVGDKHRPGILTELIRGGDLSQWGLSNAVTAYAQKVESYEEATELERVGGNIITLGKEDWELIAA
jgi:hypothetical protein